MDKLQQAREAQLSFSAEEEVRCEFERLRYEWIYATGHYSSMQHAAEHPASKAIVAMGWKVVPLMVYDQYATHTRWFIQLAEITVTNPIKEEHRGRVPKMAQDWLDWFVASLAPPSRGKEPDTALVDRVMEVAQEWWNDQPIIDMDGEPSISDLRSRLIAILRF